MVRAVHNKFHALAYGAEFAYDKLIAYKFIVVGDVLFKLFRALVIVVICVVARYYVGTCDNVFL